MSAGPFIGVRAISRSQNVRINGVKVTENVTTYVDLSPETQGNFPRAYPPVKELRSHLALGALIVVVPLTASPQDWVLEGTGGVVSATKAAEPEIEVKAGELYNRDTGAYVAFPELAAAKKKFTGEAGKSRIDIISVPEKGGEAPVYTAGTAAATGSEVAPATPEKSVLLATIEFKGKEGEPVAKEVNLTKNVVRP